ncbi:MAG: hypothetical protein ACLSB9_33200 [Hydrogeniiclostridium mannosilyticum]
MAQQAGGVYAQDLYRLGVQQALSNRNGWTEKPLTLLRHEMTDVFAARTSQEEQAGYAPQRSTKAVLFR